MLVGYHENFEDVYEGVQSLYKPLIGPTPAFVMFLNFRIV